MTLVVFHYYSQLINEIRAQGGEVVASPTLPECRIVAGNKRTFQLSNYIEKGDRDVIDFRWVNMAALN